MESRNFRRNHNIAKEKRISGAPDEGIPQVRPTSPGSAHGPPLVQDVALYVVMARAVASVPPAPPQPWQKAAGNWAFGLGGTALTVSLSTGAVAWITRASSLDDQCTDGVCPSSSKKNVDSYQTTAKVATISGIAGFALVGAGAVLYLAAPSQQNRVGLIAGPGSLGLGGSF